MHPSTPGQPGKNIFGEEITPQPGRDLEIETNEWVDFDKKTGIFEAKKAGVLKVYPHRIEVHPEFWLDGDINWDTGNVRFRGDKLIVTGDVKRGFKLLAQGDVEIHGNIEDEAEVIVNGNLLVGGLLHGEKAQLICQGEARLGAIEYAQVEIKGNLVVTDYALQACLKVAENFICTEGIGAVIGGELTAGGGILTRILGSRAQVETNIKAGCNPYLLQKIEEIKGKLALLQEEKLPLIRVLEMGIKLLKEGRLSVEKVSSLNSLRKKLASLLKEEKALKKKLGKLEREKRHLESRAQIKATDYIFAGVIIEIGEEKFTVAENMEGGIFLIQKGVLRYFPLKEN